MFKNTDRVVIPQRQTRGSGKISLLNKWDRFKTVTLTGADRRITQHICHRLFLFSFVLYRGHVTLSMLLLWFLNIFPNIIMDALIRIFGEDHDCGKQDWQISRYQGSIDTSIIYCVFPFQILTLTVICNCWQHDFNCNCVILLLIMRLQNTVV